MTRNILSDMPFRELLKQSKWSIAISMWTGKSPVSLSAAPGVKQPVLTAADVTDAPAVYVADPFMIRQNGSWFMLLEVLNAATGKGQIALATSDNAFDWTYEQIVLAEPFHLAYPHMFSWRGKIYMIPETYWTSSVKLYVATEFPHKWAYVKDLINDGCRYSDASLIHHGGKIWLFALRGANELALFYAEGLTSQWSEHPRSPLLSNDSHITRPGGRMLTFGGELIRYTQDCYPSYGNQVWAFAITKLTTKDYQEREIDGNPVLAASGTGWNRDGMHHVDAHQLPDGGWLACVDGLCECSGIAHWVQYYRHIRRTLRVKQHARVMPDGTASLLNSCNIS